MKPFNNAFQQLELKGFCSGVQNLNPPQRPDATSRNRNQVHDGKNVSNYLTCTRLHCGRKTHTGKRLLTYINPQPAEDWNTDMTELRGAFQERKVKRAILRTWLNTWGFVGTANQQLPCRNDTDTQWINLQRLSQRTVRGSRKDSPFISWMHSVAAAKVRVKKCLWVLNTTTTTPASLHTKNN